ncbi:hypothetical protein AYI69_g3901 [Smittium culicis]|uniref:Uncharacterized protein n=1 Tax=Smittium culicis TaxID=133412 RepID=A0A1R1YIE0_9FUNG|nr:hypothetical protein AYI69_g3901 [Smittium culicis]
MTDKKNLDKSFGYKNIEPARNSSIFLPNIPGKNYENLSLFDEISIFGSDVFDDSFPIDRDEFIYDELDYEDNFESIPEAESNNSDKNIANIVVDSTATDNTADHIEVEIVESMTSAHTASGDASPLSTTASPSPANSVSAFSASAPAVSARSASAITITDTENSPAEKSSPSFLAVSAPAVSVPAVSAPAVSAPAVTSSAVSSSAVSTSAVSTSDVSTSAVSISAVSTSAVSISAVSTSAVSISAVSTSAVSFSAEPAPAVSASASSGSAPYVSNKRKRAAELKSIGLFVPGPSYCATKKKPVKRPIGSRLAVITYPTKSYKKPLQPKQVPLALSGTSDGTKNAPIANISAAIACSSFTPDEYAKKVKALELLTGQRDVSVNPFCKIVVTGIDPKPFRLVKKGLIDMTILNIVLIRHLMAICDNFLFFM